jgi:ABC-2 type transport system permease protein
VKPIKDRYRYSVILLKELVRTDFKLRYQNSILGYLWTLLRPLALFCILYVVFVKFLKIGAEVPHFASYLLLGIILWNYFVEVTTGALGSVVGRGDLIRKINFPKYVIVLAGSFSALINLALNLLVVTIFMYINHAEVRVAAIVWAPLLLFELFVFALGVGFLLSTLFVRFRDINYIWEVGLQALFYATPILYPVSKVLEKSHLAAELAMLNPLAQIIQDARNLLITGSSPTVSTIYANPFARYIPVAFVVALFILSAMYFKKRSAYFAEEV